MIEEGLDRRDVPLTRGVQEWRQATLRLDPYLTLEAFRASTALGDLRVTDVEDLEEAAAGLVDAANRAGGLDNVTVLLIRYEKED